MTKVCVLIGEGKSEKAFLTSLLVHQYDFQEYTEKNCILYQSVLQPDLFWIFPVPTFGQTHRGGVSALYQPDTYIKAKSIVNNHKSFLFGLDAEVSYRILTDTDDLNEELKKEREDRILCAVSDANVGALNVKVYFARREIEAWFLAGATSAYPLLKTGTSVNKLLAIDPESHIDAKAALDSILDSSVAGQLTKIATDFGEFIDVPLALSCSDSYRDMMQSLHDDGFLELN